MVELRWIRAFIGIGSVRQEVGDAALAELLNAYIMAKLRFYATVCFNSSDVSQIAASFGVPVAGCRRDRRSGDFTTRVIKIKQVFDMYQTRN